LAEQKGQSDLIKAFSQVEKNSEGGPILVLVGDGPDRKSLESLVRQLCPGRVVFAGYQQDPLPWLAAADVFVLPSLFEGMPGALIEAMAAGLPCVATDIPGNRDLVIDRETGLLVPVRSPEELAAAISTLINDSGLANDFAANGQRLVEREFNESIERGKWQELLSTLN
jgi:glycosyltransferase involved in cell wall biosynthesis